MDKIALAYFASLSLMKKKIFITDKGENKLERSSVMDKANFLITDKGAK
jgi:hypothetical protein